MPYVTYIRLAAAWMAVGLLPMPALAQQPSRADRRIIPVIGTVRKVSGDLISIENESGLVSVFADAHTEIWKGKTFHDLSLIQVGDDFSARCRTDGSGKLVAEVIWMNIVNFFGVVTKVKGDSFEMLTNPNAIPQSSYVKKKLTVVVTPDTVFDAGSKEDLRAGREIQMVGLDLRNGQIKATRLQVWRGNGP